MTLVKGLAEALRYLHSKRVAHGDVYGHNTLVLDSTGAAKLGDFGASFYYGELAPSSQKLIERVEVRAFGVLCAEGRDRQSWRRSGGTGDAVATTTPGRRGGAVVRGWRRWVMWP